MFGNLSGGKKDGKIGLNRGFISPHVVPPSAPSPPPGTRARIPPPTTGREKSGQLSAIGEPARCGTLERGPEVNVCGL